jgi:hypothetical protein
MTTLKTLLPTILPLLATIAVALSAPVQSYIAAHPLIAAAIGTVASVINHWLPSPTSK